MSDQFVIEPLSSTHDRLSFSCGVDILDRYLRTQAGQDSRRRLSHCFVAIPVNAAVIAGYYTLAASSIPVTDLPPDLTRRLPRYPVLPAALIGRLAVDIRYAKRSLGSALLFDAVQRAGRADPAIFALMVDAKNENAAAFYRRFGFQPFTSMPTHFFLPMATTATLRGR